MGSPAHKEGDIPLLVRRGGREADGVVSHKSYTVEATTPSAALKLASPKFSGCRSHPSHEEGTTLHAYLTISRESCIRSLNCVRRIECGHVRLMSGNPPQDVHALGIGELEETRNHLQ
jgi:hypothetical protein